LLSYNDDKGGGTERAMRTPQKWLKSVSLTTTMQSAPQ
jgi:hypothetical protein